MEFEKTILISLCKNNEYTQQVISHLKIDFFDDINNKEIFKFIKKYIEQYKTLPTKSVIQHEISKSDKYNEKQFELINNQLVDIFNIKEKHNTEWLVNESEKYCKTVAFQNAVIKCYEISEKNNDKSVALEIMKEALKVEFNSECGVDFFNEDSISLRHDEYNKPDVIYETGFDTFDAAVGGIKSKALTVLLAPTGVGKTLAKISLSCGLIKNGYNVAYFTFEMDENSIAMRHEANLFDVEINNIKYLEKDNYISKFENIKRNNYGQLKIKEFPQASASCNDIEKVLDDWKIKDDFTPQVIIVDYLNLLMSSRIKDSNSYQTVKAICEEFRGLCTRRNIAGLTSTQTNRDGMSVSKLDYTKTSDSIGTVMTADVLIGILSTEQMRSDGYLIFQLMKNRNRGIIDFFFPLQFQPHFSKLIDSDDICTDQILLNNNPETLMRIEYLKKNKNKAFDKKFNKDVVLRKKETEKVDMVFDEDDDFFE